MKGKIFPIVTLLLVLALMSACAANRTQDKRAALRSELMKWENFRAEGVARVSYAGLTLRKMFVINKTQDELRLDILDGGALGINPEPLVSAYLGDYFALNSPIAPQLEVLAQNAISPGFSLDILNNPDSLLLLYGDDIIKTGKLTLENVDLGFDPDFHLIGISVPGTRTQVDITYTRKGDPDMVSVKIGSKNSLDLLVDDISYGKAKITPLPPNVTLPLVDHIMEALESFFPQEAE